MIMKIVPSNISDKKIKMMLATVILSYIRILYRAILNIDADPDTRAFCIQRF